MIRRQPSRFGNPRRGVVAWDHQDSGRRHGIDAMPDRGRSIMQRSTRGLGGQIDGIDGAFTAMCQFTDADDNRSAWWDGQRSDHAHRRGLLCDTTAILSHPFPCDNRGCSTERVP